MSLMDSENYENKKSQASISMIHYDRGNGPHPIASRDPHSSQDDLLTVAHGRSSFFSQT